jgi:hypothetical protein
MFNFYENNPKEFLKIIDGRINERVPLQTPKWFSATVISMNGGTAICHLPTDPDGTNVIVQNPRELPLEIGDQVYIVAIDGKLTNGFVDLRKGYNGDSLYSDWTTGSDSSGDGSISKPFKTLQRTINALQKNLNRRTINVYFANTGDTAEYLDMDGFYGGGTLNISPVDGGTTIKYINYVNVKGCQGVRINFNYLGTKNTSRSGFYIDYSNFVGLFHCACTEISSEFPGIFVYSSNILVANSTFSNRYIGIYASIGSIIYSSENSGSSNQNGLAAFYGGVIAKNGSQPSGITAEWTGSGGEIR